MPDLVGRTTHFGHLIVTYSKQQSEYSNDVWLNEEDELQHSTRSKEISESISNLSKPRSSTSEQQKFLAELTKVAAALFSDVSSFKDVQIGLEKRKSEDAVSQPAAVDPDRLVRLKELDELW